MKTPQEIIEILHSIEDVRLTEDGEFQVKFKEKDSIFPGGWEPIAGYIHNSFTEQLLLLIEESLNGELSE